MNELTVNVRIENDMLVTDSRNVAEVFEKRHDHVLADVERLKKDLPTFREMFFKSTMPDKYGRQQKVYLMNRDGFTLLAMGYTTSKAIQWKLKYINAFNELEKFYNSPEQVMARALRIADETINKLQNQNKTLLEDNERMKPKELFADAVSTSKTCILVRDLAKLIKQNGVDIGQNRLFEHLRKNGYLTKNNEPTQKSMDLGLFEVRESTYRKNDGSTVITRTTKVTGKGQVYFVNKFLAK